MSSSKSGNTKIDYLANLPYDVMAEIVSHMGIMTVEALKRTISDALANTTANQEKYRSVQEACDDRTSVSKYLNKNFGNGTALLTAMSKCCVYLSGSRSLGYFEPNLTTPQSDWDFYIPNSMDYIYEFMTSLEKIGVTWFEPRDEIIQRVINQNETALMTKYCVNNIVAEGILQDIATTFGLSLDVQVGTNLDDFYLVEKREAVLHFQPTERGGDYSAASNMFALIRGSLSLRGKRIPVQLMIESSAFRNGEIIAPFEYHSSCVQSFIGPYTVGHMYGKLTSTGYSYGWTKCLTLGTKKSLKMEHGYNESNIGKVPGWKKYTERGIKYKKHHESGLDASIRTIKDSDSIFMHHPGDDLAPRDIVFTYQTSSGNMTWQQTATGAVEVWYPDPKPPSYYNLESGTWMANVPGATQFCAREWAYLRKYVHVHLRRCP